MEGMMIEDHEELLRVIPPVVEGAKWEVRCHFENCRWCYFKWSEDEAKAFLRTHIIDAHLTPIEDRPFAPPQRLIG